MHFFTVAGAALALFSYALATPIIAPRAVIKYGGELNPGSYIVKLKEGISKSAHIASEVSNLGAGFTITHGQWDESFFNGYAGELLVLHYQSSFFHETFDQPNLMRTR
jgi:cerevisin